MIAIYKRSFTHSDYYKIIIIDKHYNGELLFTDSLAYNFFNIHYQQFQELAKKYNGVFLKNDYGYDYDYVLFPTEKDAKAMVEYIESLIIIHQLAGSGN